MDNTINLINDIYDNLSFFDLYGNSVLIFIFMTIFIFVVYSYCKIMQTKEAVAADWAAQRCKPQNILFAGYIAAPKGTSPFTYTNENFQYCIQGILMNISQYALEPFQFMLQGITLIFDEIAAAIQQIRIIIDRVRNTFKDVATDILERVINVMVPIQKIFISVIDAFNKIQGIMVSGLYTMLGTYYTLQSLMGAILEFVIKLLIILVIIIAGLWILPFTWPLASTMSLVFLSLSIPLAIVALFMSQVLHIKTSGIPSLRCFDKRTLVSLMNKGVKNMEELSPGDILSDGSVITAKIKVVASGLDMFNLKDIVISGCHKVKHNGRWISVRDHPDAVLVTNYKEPYLYCINTSTKTIVLNNIVFTDWDEIYDETLEFILNYKGIETTDNISKTLDNGFDGRNKIKLVDGYKTIKDIEIGDILSSGGVVYGIVELNNNLGISESNNLYHLLVSNKYFVIGEKRYADYNNNIDAVIELRKILSKEYV